MLVLGIETSCDDTAVALYETQRGLLAHLTQSQLDTHRPHGGVVPELASRDHSQYTLRLIRQIITQAEIPLSNIDAIACTIGPGLAGALMVGACVGQSLAWALDRPCVGVHHLEGHLLAPFLEEQKPSFPYCALLVSGGHTQLIDVQKLGQYRLLGETLDDAVGEAFDKVAKLMGLPYPGGPEISRLAKQGDPSQFKLTQPMINRPGLEMSFSGLKTQVMNAWEASSKSSTDRANLAASFELTIVQTLRIKCERAIKETHHRGFVLTGGVSANRALRVAISQLCAEHGIQFFCPRPAFCTDNAAMVAYAGSQRILSGGLRNATTIRIHPRWPLDGNF